VAALVFMTPVFVVLYELTVPNGPWRLVLAVQVIAMGAMALASIRFFATGIWVDPTELRERGFFGRTTHLPVAEIGSLISAETFAGSGEETSPQLFVCDHDGKQLVRMRGQFWSRENMEIVIATLDVPHTTLDDAVSRGELQASHPGLLYWFERRPLLAALAFTGATGIFGVIAMIVLNALGISLSAD
jgi:hypothetical protein